MELDTTLSIAGKAADAKAVGDALKNLSVSGLTIAQINALDSMFKVCAFIKGDISAEYTAFKTAFDISDSGGGTEEPDIPDVPDEPDDPDVPTYTVTNNLTKVTTDNTTESVEGGKMYTANLTAEAGYTIDSVVVTMGGNVISAYGDGVVYIDSVDGDVVITATAVQTNTGAAVYELAQATTFDGTSTIDTGYQLNLTNDAWTICVDFTGSAGQAFGTHGTVDAHEMRVALASGYYWQASLCGKAVNGYTKNNACKYVITHGKGETQATAYYLKDGAVVSDSGATHWGSANSNPTTLKLGGKRDGTADFVGTINRFAIYERALTAEEISEFMGIEDPGNEEPVVYSVTNNLTNVTNSNTATTASGYYSATLSADDGYNISVTITMGGVDITDSVYTEDGTILITEVTGDIVITATAELATAPVLYQLANTPRTVNADLFEDTGLAFGSETANGYTKAWTMVARVKNMTAGTLWSVNGNTGLRSYYEKRWNGAVQNNAVHLTTAICATVCRPSITADKPDEICIVITKEAMAGNTASVHYVTYDGGVTTETLNGTYGTFFHEVYAGKLMVGGLTSADFVGTIEEFTIYEGVAAEDQIKSYLGVV